MAGTVYLRRGDSGDYVEQVQHRLAGLGFSPGGTDGGYGRRTTEAVRAFQEAHRLEVTGQIDESTWTALFSTVPG
jgi:peptidoglycan hydrolase-like protein with peptidoglycan-binding domain